MIFAFVRTRRDHSVSAVARTGRSGTAHWLCASVVMVIVGSPATADAPRATASGVVCSLNGRFCAFRTRDARSVEIRRHTGKSMLKFWRANVVSPRLLVGDDGRSLVEIRPDLNLVDQWANACTIVLIFHRADSTAAPLRLRDISIDPARLPITISHRAWARAYGYDGRNSFIVETHDGRRLHFDPATWRPK